MNDYKLLKHEHEPLKPDLRDSYSLLFPYSLDPQYLDIVSFVNIGILMHEIVHLWI